MDACFVSCALIAFEISKSAVKNKIREVSCNGYFFFVVTKAEAGEANWEEKRNN